MTKEILKAIRLRIAGASDGPWKWIPTGICRDKMADVTPISTHNHTPYVSHGDAAFIAHSREDLPKLLDALEAGIKALEYYQDELCPADYPSDRTAIDRILVDK